MSGVTLVELLLTTSLLGLLTAIAIPSYSAVIERQRLAQARYELMQISIEIVKRRDGAGRLPLALAGIPNLPALDPWGNPYVYNNFSRPGFKKTDIRKDKNLHPLNSEFDLYSLGKDGDSRPPLTAKPSWDDMIIARDGGFVGLGKEF